MAALCREIALREEFATGDAFGTIFFGGGTPSLLTPRQLDAILRRLHATFAIAPDAEITLEANPGTVTGESLRAYRSQGVTRLSLGVQSFHDSELKALGRIHDRAEALRAVRLARAAGFDNLGLDLIYAIPGQTRDRWEETLRTGTALAPQHIAAYALTLENGTPLARLVETGNVRPAPADLEAELYERAMEILEADGFEHYEVSNYARPSFACRHNRAYWSHQNYLGLGPSAHSFWKDADGAGGRRWWNLADAATYRTALQGGKLPMGGEERVDVPTMLRERIFLGLRSGGLNLARLRMEFGDDLAARCGATLQPLLAGGLASRDRDVLCLTRRGYLVCDEICRMFLP